MLDNGQHHPAVIKATAALFQVQANAKMGTNSAKQHCDFFHRVVAGVFKEAPLPRIYWLKTPEAMKG